MNTKNNIISEYRKIVQNEKEDNLVFLHGTDKIVSWEIFYTPQQKKEG